MILYLADDGASAERQETMMAEQDTQDGMDRDGDLNRQDQDRDQGIDRQQNQQNRDQGAGQDPNRSRDGGESGAGYGNHGEGGQDAVNDRDDTSNSDRR
ncbi:MULTISPECIES: hypothetical protein [unclassified Sphingomonas]|uniref:hypothetical protein n=1 Tax=unclassified Sphingomonas TaxID=196159 RepID=UPI0025EA1617|nr:MULTISPECIES: hypothetical protein [unclassified Sphingomonas]